MELPRNVDPTPVFILGSIRSGTTLLQSLLDGHPQLLVDAGESRFIPRTFPYVRFLPRHRRAIAAERRLLYLFADGSRYGEKYLQHVAPAEVRQSFHRFFDASRGRPADLLTSYLLAYGVASGQLTERTQYWVEKTPYHELHAPRLLRWFPSCRAIYLARDPRDVFSSIQKRALRKGSRASARSFSFAWRKSVAGARWLHARIGGSRTLFLRYEDLSRDPGRALREIREFLDIDDHPKLHQPTKGGGRVPWGGNPASGQRSDRVRPPVTYDWLEWLSEQELQVVETELGEAARFVGYDWPDAQGRRSVIDPATWLREIRFFLKHRL